MTHSALNVKGFSSSSPILSFSSRNRRKVFKTFLFTLEVEQRTILFSFRKLRKFCLISLLEKGNSYFSFSSQNWRNCFQIALFLLDLTLLSFVNQVRVAHSRVVLHSLILKYLKWATNFNADREKALSHYHAYNCHIVTLPWHTF